MKKIKFLSAILITASMLLNLVPISVSAFSNGDLADPGISFEYSLDGTSGWTEITGDECFYRSGAFQQDLEMPDNTFYVYFRITGTPDGWTAPSTVRYGYTPRNAGKKVSGSGKLVGSTGTVEDGSLNQLKVYVKALENDGVYKIPIKNEESWAAFTYTDDSDTEYYFEINFQSKQPRLTSFTDNMGESQNVLFISGAAVNNDNGTVLETYRGTGTNRTWTMGYISESLLGASMFIFPDTDASKEYSSLFEFAADTGGTVYMMVDDPLSATGETRYSDWTCLNNGTSPSELSTFRETANIFKKARTYNSYTGAYNSAVTNRNYYAVAMRWVSNTNSSSYSSGNNSYRATSPGVTGNTKSTYVTASWEMYRVYSKEFDAGDTVVVPGWGNNTVCCAVLIQWQLETPTVTDPVASVASGLVTSGTSVSLSTETAGATIYYTTDGSTPTTSSRVYSSPISITSNTEIKAFAVKAGSTNSGVSTFNYAVWDSSDFELQYSADGTNYSNAVTDADFTLNPSSGAYEMDLVLPDNAKYAYLKLIDTPEDWSAPSVLKYSYKISGATDYFDGENAKLIGNNGNIGTKSFRQMQVLMKAVVQNGAQKIPIKNEQSSTTIKYTSSNGIARTYSITLRARQPRLTSFTDNMGQSQNVVFISGAAVNNDNGTVLQTNLTGSDVGRQYSLKALAYISEPFLGASMFVLPTISAAASTSANMFQFSADHGGTVYMMVDDPLSGSNYDSWTELNNGTDPTNLSDWRTSNTRFLRSRDYNGYSGTDYWAASLQWYYGGATNDAEDENNAYRADVPGVSAGNISSTNIRNSYLLHRVYSKTFEADETVIIPGWGNTSGDSAVLIQWEDADVAQPGTHWTKAEIVSGTGANADAFKVSVKAKTEMTEIPAGAHIYFGVYSSRGKLLAFDTADYDSGEEANSDYFSKSYAEDEPSYAKAFVWSEMIPLTLSKNILINRRFDNSGIKVLAIGNSFSQDSISKLKEIAAADGIKITSYNAYLAGRTLKGHYDAWGSDTTYRVQPEGTHTDTYKTLQEFAEMEDWDYVMLQGTTHYAEYDAGLWNVNAANTRNYWTTLKNGIEELAPNAKRLVNATWAPINELSGRVNDGMFASGTPDSRGAYLTALLPNEQIGAEIYSTETRADGGKEYIPVAVAVDYLVRHYRFPEYVGELEDSEYDNSSATRAVYRDKTCHLTDNVGRVLAGLVWYEMITGIPATQNKYQRDTLSQSDMIKLKEAAHYACRNYTTYNPSSIAPIASDNFDADIMKVKNGADAAIVFVHDDGGQSTATYLSREFEKNNLNGTVAIIGTKVDESSEVSAWTSILSDAHDRLNFASHSYYHEYMGQTDAEHTNYFDGVAKVYPAGYMTQTIAAERARINGLFPNERVLAFVKPGVTKPDGITTQLSSEARAMIREHYIGMRDTGGGVDTLPPADCYAVKSLMSKVGECELSDWQSALTEAVNQKGLLVYLFHTIKDADSVSNLDSRQSDVSVLLEEMGEKVADGTIWSAKFDEAMQYTREYAANAQARVMAYYSGNYMTVRVTDEISKTDPDLTGTFAGRDMYDYPLTVKTPIPFNWTYVKLTQSYGSRVEVVKTFIESGTRYAYVNVVPDQTAARLVEASSSDYLSGISYGGTAIASFDPAKMYYKVTLPHGTASAPTLTCNQGSAVITQATLSNGEGSGFITFAGLKYEVHFSVE